MSKSVALNLNTSPFLTSLGEVKEPCKSIFPAVEASATKTPET